jgi:hypothetical protein
MFSWMNDSRIVFLLWFVGIAIAVAVFLIFIEIRLKKRRKKEEEKKKEKSPVDDLRVTMEDAEKLKDKLILLDKAVKDYFVSKYKLDRRMSYASLKGEVEGRGNSMDIELCDKMFEAYYSDKKLTIGKVKELLKVFEAAYEKRIALDKQNRPEGFWEIFDEFFERLSSAVIGSVENYVAIKGEAAERRTRRDEAKERELLSWVRRAVRMGYSKVNVLSLLDKEGRTKKEIDKIMEIYEREVVRRARDVSRKVFSGQGVAQRIVKDEKGRIEKGEAFGVLS